MMFWRHPRPAGPLPLAVVLVALVAPACGATATGAAAPAAATVAVIAVPPPSASPTTDAVPPPVPSTTTSPTTATTSTSTTTSSPTITATSTTIAEPPPSLDALRAAALGLADGNAAVSVSVWRAGAPLFGWASGSRVDGSAVDSDTPFVIASVSKLVTAITVARLVQRDDIHPGDRVPWDAIGVAHDRAWNDVTVGELLAHTSGMPVNRKSWLDEPGTCDVPLTAALATPPAPARGTWVYSNGNYCALGLLVQHTSGMPLDEAANDLVFEPASVAGPYLSTEGVRASSAPYAKGVARLERLGGAGTWLASSDDIAAMLAAVTVADLETLRWPGIIVDQYGWGHTGTIDGAKACAWVLDERSTVLVAMVSGQRPRTGGEVCDMLLPALATDLGVWAGDPVRNPL
ncbi:MAG: serine hydrolase domain-containing protein [Actinomycetota bacterium]